MKKIVGKICKYICATLCVVALACFAGLTNLDKKSEGGSTKSALVSVNEATNKYMVVGGKVYTCPEEADTNSAEDETSNSVVASTMDNPVEALQGISIYNSDLEIVFLKDGITDYNQAVRSLRTATTATQLTKDIASIVTATRTADSVEISIEDEKQTAIISTSLDAVYSLNALALSVNSSLEYDNGNFMVASQQASVSLLADTTTVFAQKSALVMRLSEGNVTIKGRNEDNVVTYAPSSSTLGMGRAFYQTGGNLTIGENVVLQDFSATDSSLAGGASGGAIYVSNSSSTLTLNCTITNCAATYWGGAIYSNGTIVINGGSYSNNEASNRDGGFIYNYLNGSSGGIITLNDGIISNNICYGGGGAIYSTNVVNLNGGTIENNSAEDTDTGGGGVYGSTININGTTIKGNSTNGQGSGGGVYGSTVNFTSGTISNNTVNFTSETAPNNSTYSCGGGIYATTCTVAKGATITGNKADRSGGGIYAKTLKFTGSATISSNISGTDGGGIYIPSGGSYTSSGESIVANKTLDGVGGGICYDSSNALYLSGYIIGNSSASDGGGIEATSASSITLKGGSQIFNNYATAGGGGVDCGCIISYDNGSSSIGIFSNSCGYRGNDIYFNDTSAYINLIAGKSYEDGTIVSVYKNGLKTTSSSNINMILKSTSNSAASQFRKYLNVENFSISGEATYQCRMNLIEWDDTTTTSLYAEKDVCLLSFKPGNEWTDYFNGYNIYYDDNIYACFTDRAKEFSGSSAVVTTSGRSWQFTNGFTVNFWATMSNWKLYSSEMVMASSGVSSNTKGWKFMYGTDGVISCALYDSGSGSYKYANLTTKYSDLSNNGEYMFTLTVSNSCYATLYLSKGGKIIDKSGVQLNSSVAYYYVVGQNTSSTVLGGLSNGTGSVASGHYWNGTMQMFEIVNEIWTSEIIEQICTEGTSQGAGVFKMGIGGQTYTLATPLHPDSKAFAGWDREQEFSGQMVRGENVFTFGSNDETYLSRIFGVWTTGTYTVVYDANGGTGSMSSQSFNHTHTSSDGTYKLNKNTFTRDGYTFEGWSESTSAAEVTYSDGYIISVGSDPLTTGGIIRLYAVWKAKIIHITLDRQDSSVGTIGFYYQFGTNKYYSSYSENDGLNDKWVSSKVTPATQKGHDFKGYYTDLNGEGTCWIKDTGFLVDGLYNSISEDTTLHAYFKPKTITITLNNQGGRGITTLYCKYNENKFSYDLSFSITFKKLSSLPTFNGYNFMGYYANPSSYTSSSAVQYIDANGNISSELCKATTEDSITIHANWQVKTYKVTIQVKQPSVSGSANFNGTFSVKYVLSNGAQSASPTSCTFTVEYGTAITGSTSGNVLTLAKNGITVATVSALINNSFIPDGYTVAFNYWTGTAGSITDNRTIYAYYKATPITYTLKFTYLNNNNTKVFDGEDPSIRLTLTEDKESDSTRRWYYIIEYTIEDEIFLPYAEKEYYTVNGWYISSASDGDWEKGLYECGESYEGYWGNAIFSLNTTANAIRINFICDPDGEGREDDIYAKYSVLENKTIWVSFNGSLKSDAFYYVGTTKTYLNWTEAPWVGGVDGWYKNAKYTGSAIKATTQCNYEFFEKPASGEDEFNLYCKWKPITIVFYGKTPLEQGFNDSIYTSSQATIKLLNPVTSATSGYTFKGWYTGKNGTGSYVGGAKEDYKVIATYTPLYLYACWEANKYTITWDASSSTSGLLQAKYWNYANGNYTSSSDDTNRTSNYTTTTNNFIITSKVTYGSTGLGYCAPTPIRAGYSFLYWADAYGNYILQSDYKTFESSTEGIPSPINEDGAWDLAGNTTLKAVWTANTYTITVDTNGGAYSGTAPTSYSASNSATINIPSRTGHTFKGWSVTASLKRSTQATISNGYLEYISSYPNAVFYGPFYMASGITYSATKRSASGSNATINWVEYETDGSFSSSTRSTSETLAGQGKYVMLWYHNGNTNSKEDVSFTTSAEAFSTSTYKSTGNLKLTANWETNKYIIEYKLAGGTAGPNAPTSANYDQTFSVSNPQTRTGYEFAGWTITGMDNKKHGYGTSSSSLTETSAYSLSGIKATYFKNLRETSGTVIFTAVWLVTNIEITVTTDGGTIGYYINSSYYDATEVTLYGVLGKNSLSARDSRAGSMNEPKYYDGESKYYTDKTVSTTNQAYATAVNFATSRKGYIYNGLYLNGTLVVSELGVVQPNITISGYKITDEKGCWLAWSNPSASASIGLTAKWTANTYTVQFVEDSLSSAPTVGGSYTQKGDYEYTITYGKTFTVSNPKRDGYEFAGWYITNNGGTNEVSSTDMKTSFINLTTKKGDVVSFEALWKTKYINLSIDENDGSLSFGHSLDKLFVCYNDSFIYYIPTEYQNSAYYNSNGENTYVDSNGFIKTIPADSITLISVSNFSASRTGYKFNGLSATRSIFNENLTADQGNLNSAILSALSAQSETLDVFTWWRANTYTVKFDNVYAYGTSELEVSGLEAITNEKYKYTATYDTAFTVNNPTRNTYTFTGWTITGMDNTTHYYGASLSTTSTTINSTKMTTFKNLTSENRATVTFTASWEAKTYNITLDANGGTCSVDSIDVVYGSTYGELPTPTRSGYTFDGWYTKSDGGTLVESTDKHLQSSMTFLYAHWVVIKYVIKYELHLYSNHASGLTLQYDDNHNSSSNAKTGTYDVQNSTRTGTISEFTVEDKLTINAQNVSYDTNSSKYYGIIVYTKNPNNKYVNYFTEKYNSSKSQSQNVSIEIDSTSLIKKFKDTGENSLIIQTFYNNGGNNYSEYVTASGYKYVHKVTLSDGNPVETGGFLAEANIYEDSTNINLNKVSFSANQFIYKDSNGNSQRIAANETYEINGITYNFANWYYYDTNQNKNVEVANNTEIEITSDRSFGARYVAYGKTINYECYYDYDTCSDVYLVINGNEYRGKGSVYVNTNTTIKIWATNVKALNTETNGIWSSYKFADSSENNGGYAYSTSYAGGITITINKNIDLSTLFTRSDDTLILRSRKVKNGTTTYGNVPTTYVMNYTLYHPWESYNKEYMTFIAENNSQHKLYAKYSVLNSDMTSTTTKETLIDTATTTLLKRTGTFVYGEGMEFIAEFVNLAFLSSEIDEKVYNNITASCLMTYNSGDGTTSTSRIYSKYGLGFTRTSDNCTCGAGHSLYTMRILIGDLSSTLSEHYERDINIIFVWGYWNG